MTSVAPDSGRSEKPRKTISIMTPCFNEQDNVAACRDAVKAMFGSELKDYDYEHIFIDNAWTDATGQILRDICATDDRVKVIFNSRNYGPHRSPYYGLLQMTGDAVIPIMCDLQTPTRFIPIFVRKWEEGFKLVLAVRQKAHESLLLKFLRKTYYGIISQISEVEQVQHFIGFGLFDRHVIHIIRNMDDSLPYFRGIVNEIGFEKCLIEYDQPPRLHGRSKQKWADLLEYAIIGLTYSSRAPLRLVTLTGFAISGITFIIGLTYLALKLMFWDSFPIGLAPVLIGMLFLGSIQIIFLGFVAEYVGMTFERVRRRPLVIERERINF